jgi:ABC-type branched-subunit amino acid transport system ATPase component
MKQFNAEMFTPSEFSFANWSNVAVVDPAAAKRLIWRFVATSVMTGIGWMRLSNLSYGQRRRLAVEAALPAADMVAIENFEAGFHADYVAELIKQIAESSTTAIIEDHSGLVLKLAMRYGRGGRIRILLSPVILI